jgi:uncharacterized membrane protein required for colicin V production
VLGLVLATRTMHTLGETLTQWWSIHEVVGAVLAFVIVFFGVIIVQVLVVSILRSRSKPPRLLSRLTGSILGLVEGGIYISLVFIVLNLFSIPNSNIRSQSLLYLPVRNFAPSVFDATNYLLSGTMTFDQEVKRSFRKFRLSPDE